MYKRQVVYDFGKITDWISSIGTLGAVIVTLYLANRERKPRAKVTASFMYAVDEFGFSEKSFAGIGDRFSSGIGDR